MKYLMFDKIWVHVFSSMQNLGGKENSGKSNMAVTQV